jgi:hypothetical protein
VDNSFSQVLKHVNFIGRQQTPDSTLLLRQLKGQLLNVSRIWWLLELLWPFTQNSATVAEQARSIAAALDGFATIGHFRQAMNQQGSFVQFLARLSSKHLLQAAYNTHVINPSASVISRESSDIVASHNLWLRTMKHIIVKRRWRCVRHEFFNSDIGRDIRGTTHTGTLDHLKVIGTKKACVHCGTTSGKGIRQGGTTQTCSTCLQNICERCWAAWHQKDTQAGAGVGDREKERPRKKARTSDSAVSSQVSTLTAPIELAIDE